jgi:hypothetical protein
VVVVLVVASVAWAGEVTWTDDKTPTTPVPILRFLDSQNPDGSYTYGYQSADGTYKIETRFVSGDVKGKYGYIDSNGNIKETQYGSTSERGFEPWVDGVPLAPSTLDDEVHGLEPPVDEQTEISNAITVDENPVRLETRFGSLKLKSEGNVDKNNKRVRFRVRNRKSGQRQNSVNARKSIKKVKMVNGRRTVMKKRLRATPTPQIYPAVPNKHIESVNTFKKQKELDISTNQPSRTISQEVIRNQLRSRQKAVPDVITKHNLPTSHLVPKANTEDVTQPQVIHVNSKAVIRKQIRARQKSLRPRTNAPRLVKEVLGVHTEPRRQHQQRTRDRGQTFGGEIEKAQERKLIEIAESQVDLTNRREQNNSEALKKLFETAGEGLVKQSVKENPIQIKEQQRVKTLNHQKERVNTARQRDFLAREVDRRRQMQHRVLLEDPRHQNERLSSEILDAKQPFGQRKILTASESLRQQSDNHSQLFGPSKLLSNKNERVRGRGEVHNAMSRSEALRALEEETEAVRRLHEERHNIPTSQIAPAFNEDIYQPETNIPTSGTLNIERNVANQARQYNQYQQVQPQHQRIHHHPRIHSLDQIRVNPKGFEGHREILAIEEPQQVIVNPSPQGLDMLDSVAGVFSYSTLYRK